MIKKLCIISTRYPSSTDPIYAFLGTLVEQIADMGIECHVISPVSCIERYHRASSRTEYSPKGNPIYVHCPRYVSVPLLKLAYGPIYRFRVNRRRAAVVRAYRKCVKDCDAFYSHFLESGNDAAWLRKLTGKPAFVACGESNIQNNRPVYTLYRDNIYDGLNGIIYVSTAIRADAERLDVFSRDIPAAVFPNGVNAEVFFRRDPRQCREKLGAEEEDFVVAFVGSFIKRKGFDKLGNILLRHPRWKCILIGEGELRVQLPSSRILYMGKTEHDEIPALISAADVFVLPSLAEGCCNAIIEALACGLPVISSRRPFNDDILDESCALLVDPENEDAIEAAMLRLERDGRLRRMLSEGALHKASELTIRSRAQRIVQFLEKCMDNENSMDQAE